MKEYTNKKDLLDCLNSLYKAEVIDEFAYNGYCNRVNEEFE